MHVREATTADVGAVVALVESAYRGETSRAGWTTEADLLTGQRTDAHEVGALIDAGTVLVAMSPDAGDPGRVLPSSTRPGTSDVRRVTRGTGRRYRVRAARRRRAKSGGERCRPDHADRDQAAAGPDPLYERRGYRRTGEEQPFPYGDERFGRPLRDDLAFVVLAKEL